MRNSNANTLPDFWSNLLLIRHGESSCNEANRFAGSVDAPLTRLGRAQAEQAAKTFAGPTPDRLFVSNLSRARETAEILFPQAEAGLTHEVDDRLTERHFGEFTLRNKAELQATHGIRGYDEALYDPDGAIRGAESFAEFQHRVEQFLTETITPLLRSGERVLVVAHKYVVELMVRLVLDLPLQGAYDLRLPNSKVLNAGDAEQYVRKESRTGNRLREWIGLYHGEALAAAGLIGLGVSAIFGPPNIPWQLGFALLMVATMISLLRVDLGQAVQTKSSDWGRTLTRFAVIPGLAALFVIAADAPVSWIVVVLALAAPAALTSVTLSRCAGGMVHPAVGTMIRSTLIGTITILVLVGIFFDWTAAAPTALVAASAIGIPCALTLLLRRHKPIAAANFAERQAAWPVILLAVFVGISCAQLNLNDLFTTGALAVGFSLALRLVSATLTRWSSCVAPDDYLSLGFPNLFLLVVFGQILGLPELTSFAAWLLVPMFLLAPVDVWLCRRFAAKGAGDWTLQGYLCLGHAGRLSEFCPLPAENCSASTEVIYLGEAK
ncbi:MAG: broad specificity phosphatase PhoE [Verrucomicrobiales bacterium]|jgi:broad specificity phosphatase PhoE